LEVKQREPHLNIHQTSSNGSLDHQKYTAASAEAETSPQSLPHPRGARLNLLDSFNKALDSNSITIRSIKSTETAVVPAATTEAGNGLKQSNDILIVDSDEFIQPDAQQAGQNPNEEIAQEDDLDLNGSIDVTATDDMIVDEPVVNAEPPGGGTDEIAIWKDVPWAAEAAATSSSDKMDSIVQYRAVMREEDTEVIALPTPTAFAPLPDLNISPIEPPKVAPPMDIVRVPTEAPPDGDRMEIDSTPAAPKRSETHEEEYKLADLVNDLIISTSTSISIARMQYETLRQRIIEIVSDQIKTLEDPLEPPNRDEMDTAIYGFFAQIPRQEQNKQHQQQRSAGVAAETLPGIPNGKVNPTVEEGEIAEGQMVDDEYDIVETPRSKRDRKNNRGLFVAELPVDTTVDYIHNVLCEFRDYEIKLLPQSKWHGNRAAILVFRSVEECDTAREILEQHPGKLKVCDAVMKRPKSSKKDDSSRKRKRDSSIQRRSSR
jgi:hypothetical protein